jgi:predicted transcriptional regulator
MRSVTVSLPDEAADRLIELAEREARRPKDQAAVLLIAAVRRAARRAARGLGEAKR